MTRVVTGRGRQSDEDDEVVETGPERAGREVERVLKALCGSVFSFGDRPRIHGYPRRVEQPASRPDAIDVVDEDLHAPAAAYEVGEAAADAPVDFEVPGVGNLHGPDPFVALSRVEHVH